MTETRFYEPARLSTPPKPLFSLKQPDADLVEARDYNRTVSFYGSWLRSLLSKVFRERLGWPLLAIMRLRRELGKIRLPKTIP